MNRPESVVKHDIGFCVAFVALLSRALAGSPGRLRAVRDLGRERFGGLALACRRRQLSLPMIRGPIARAIHTGSLFQQATIRRYFGLSGRWSGGGLPSGMMKCQ